MPLRSLEAESERNATDSLLSLAGADGGEWGCNGGTSGARTPAAAGPFGPGPSGTTEVAAAAADEVRYAADAEDASDAEVEDSVEDAEVTEKAEGGLIYCEATSETASSTASLPLAYSSIAVYPPQPLAHGGAPQAYSAGAHAAGAPPQHRGTYGLSEQSPQRQSTPSFTGSPTHQPSSAAAQPVTAIVMHATSPQQVAHSAGSAHPAPSGPMIGGMPAYQRQYYQPQYYQPQYYQPQQGQLYYQQQLPPHYQQQPIYQPLPLQQHYQPQPQHYQMAPQPPPQQHQHPMQYQLQPQQFADPPASLPTAPASSLRKQSRSEDGTTPDEDEEFECGGRRWSSSKKHKHNVAERRRTSRLNALFEELAQIVVSRADLYREKQPGNSKADVLTTSVSCIRHCFSTIDQLKGLLNMALAQLNQSHEDAGASPGQPLSQQALAARVTTLATSAGTIAPVSVASPIVPLSLVPPPAASAAAAKAVSAPRACAPRVVAAAAAGIASITPAIPVSLPAAMPVPVHSIVPVVALTAAAGAMAAASPEPSRSHSEVAAVASTVASAIHLPQHSPARAQWKSP